MMVVIDKPEIVEKPEVIKEEPVVVETEMDLLCKAADLIETSGWCQHQSVMQSPGAPARYCVRGALVTVGLLGNITLWDYPGRDRGLYSRATARLIRVIHAYDIYHRHHGGSSVEAWKRLPPADQRERSQVHAHGRRLRHARLKPHPVASLDLVRSAR